jgi:3-hydroxybutyryl-CoA dehydratase
MIFSIGDSFEEIFIVSDETYIGFIQTFKDTNPLHTIDTFAFNKGFKGKIMHGNILNGFLSYFIGECLPTKNVIIHSQEIQFKNAVYLNDQLHLHAKIVGVYDSVNAIEFRYDFKNESKKIVAKGKIQIGLFK